MGNAVYNMVCEAFGNLISHRAAENLVVEALKEIGLTPEKVTAEQMHDLLRKGIFRRLQRIIPVVQAKGEIKVLLKALEGSLGIQLVSQPEVKPEAQSEVKPEVVADSKDTVTAAAKATVLTSEIPKTAPIPAPIAPPPMPPAHVTSTVETRWEPAAPMMVPMEPVVEPPLIQASPTEELFEIFDSSLFDNPEAIFEFDLTALPKRRKRTKAPREDKPVLKEVAYQDALLSRFAMEEGVSDVLLSDRAGVVLNGRGRNTGQALAALSARSVQIQNGIYPSQFYIDLDTHFIWVVPLDLNILLTVVASSSTNIGRILGEILAVKEEL